MSTFYVPIYKWGPDRTAVIGICYGTKMYISLDDLYAFEWDYGKHEQPVIGHAEVNVCLPTQEEFELMEVQDDT